MTRVLAAVALLLALAGCSHGGSSSDDGGLSYDGTAPTQSQITQAYHDCEIEVGDFNRGNGGVVYQSSVQVMEDCLTREIGPYR